MDLLKEKLEHGRFTNDVVKCSKRVYINFNGKNYDSTNRYSKLIPKCMKDDLKAQYELTTEYYQIPRPKDFIPEIYFYYTNLIALKEKDLGILTEFGDLYYEGVGVTKNKEKAVNIYKRALFLFDNPTSDLYIPDKTDKYRAFLEETIQKYSK